jgi:hypothetical protein
VKAARTEAEQLERHRDSMVGQLSTLRDVLSAWEPDEETPEPKTQEQQGKDA